MPAAIALPAISVNPSISQRLAALDQGQKLRLAVGIVLFVVIGVVGLVMGRQAEWRVLYANLAEKDGGAIVAQLTTMNVPYKYADGGGAILVPADKVYDTRLKLASQGLPKGTVTGYELMDTASRFGMTQFQERLTFQRGLEGELTRSIQALASVASARVHLALPNQNGFFREQQKPSASVVVGMNAGRSLDRGQLAGIIHLVSSSVPEMDPKSVSVLDDTGKLLSTPPEGDMGMGGDAQQLQHVQQLEQLYTKRILDILEPVVGRQNVRAQVTAELDFSQTESTSELFTPNQTPDATAIRSQQLMESTTANSGLATGVPGAVTNQPPGPTEAPINGAAQTPVAANGVNATVGGVGRKESIINYEVDKTVRVVRGSTGMVKRISAAVVLNHQTNTDAKGKTTTVPLTDEQLAKMTTLVRETIGFSQERGDSVNVVNAPFTTEKVTPVDVPVWQQPEMLDLARSIAWPVGTLLFGALVLLGAIRPALKVMAQPVPARAGYATAGGALDAIESDELARPLLAGPSVSSLSMEPSPSDLALEEARKLTRDNPAAVANIVKTWISGEASA
ncbi:flagellar basal-body MS-ring/collar protein FliF [Rhodoferax antarcticus]|uniref:Flagellar M-ring protein n=1 Tax=Rhodoferax antarcticus ANT.BR TaxID=1111071 RepID=A0A1Q8YGK8_9BURK|nr:flagellar basal-body MS-ring/collar protein FliF [Rhodoferax antarcticus]APW45639.1 flagellar M-ring protein FliF [Rhodoferax antarcticus]MCW2312783.1 flagellar M-ring protein FliF [Rhodoferax antarcticus]OLP07126.1 flagellar M-ring protein [Rhodoferax antarcticus ANT.BR]